MARVQPPAICLGAQQQQRHASRWRPLAAAVAALQHRRQRRQRRCSPVFRVWANEGMYVPSDSFGGVSPERKAAEPLQAFFTFVACKIVMSQLQGVGRSDLGAYNATGATVLRRLMQEESMRDSDAWLAKLMAEDELLGVRIMEVRAAYAQSDFEWDNLKRLAIEGIEEGNTRLLRQHASQRFGTLLTGQSGRGSSEAAGGGGGEDAAPGS